jgi:exodeoxyribonuclease-1
MAFVFYDTETTGLQTAFDQVLQFAAILTDDDFNELDHLNIRCRLLPHVVPSPGALVATRVNPAMLIDSSMPSHYAAIRLIRAKLIEWSPAIFVGYNSLSYDEELIRQSLFQTLHPAYLTNTNGNSRGDIMKLVQAASVYAPNSIVVPINEKGNQSFKLDQIAPANGLNHSDAHEALADVRATIFMAKRVRERAPRVWERMNAMSKKGNVANFVAKTKEFSWTERYFAKSYSFLVTSCGVNPEYTAQLAVFDLAHNPDDYRSLSIDELIQLLGANKKGIRTIKANAQPILMNAEMAPADAKGSSVPPRERARRIHAIANDAEFRMRVGQALSLRFADEPSPTHVEQQIYAGFTKDDDPWMEKFHGVDWPDRVSIASNFKDARVTEFGRRLFYFEHPHGLPDKSREELKAWIKNKCLTKEEVPWTTIPSAMAEMDVRMPDATRDAKVILKDLKDFLSDLTKSLARESV